MTRPLDDVFNVAITKEIMESVIENTAHGHYNDSQIAAYLIACRMKKITPEALASAVRVLLKHAQPIFSDRQGVSIQSTGGSAFKVLNVSTIAAIITAASGVPVRKQTSRAMRSSLGSYDLLEALGMRYRESPAQDFVSYGLCFYRTEELFPIYRIVNSIRRSLRVCTIFDWIAPVANAFFVEKHIIGVSNKADLYLLASSFEYLPPCHVLLVYGLDHMDEVSVTHETKVIEVHNYVVKEYQVSPKDFYQRRHSDVCVEPTDNFQEQLQRFYNVMDGESSAYTDLSLMNAAVLLSLAYPDWELGQAFAKAQHSLLSGLAKQKLSQILSHTNS